MKFLNTFKQVAQIGYYTHGMMYRHNNQKRAESRQYNVAMQQQLEEELLAIRDELAKTILTEMETKFKDDAKWNRLTLAKKLDMAIEEAEAEMFLHPEKYLPKEEETVQLSQQEVSSSIQSATNNSLLVFLFFGGLFLLMLFHFC